jgi:D-sedoheptulose 7-phosphate isomerase
MLNWIKNYFQTLHDLSLNSRVTDLQGKVIGIDEGFKRNIQLAKATRENNTKIMFIGNGGSAGIASHMAIDHSKNGRLPAMAFSDAAAITCLSNDYGYEFVFEKQIEYHARKGDLLIAISSSGKSKNILNGVAAARKIGCNVITYSGFDVANPLAKLGDINFYVDSKEYGFVEVGHQAIMHAILDFICEEQHRKMQQQNSILQAETV